MLLVYRLDTGEVVANSGTSTAWPEGPPDDLAYVSTDVAGIPREDLGLLRLHDVEDEEVIQSLLGRQVTVIEGRPVPGRVLPTTRSTADLDPFTRLERRVTELERQVAELRGGQRGEPERGEPARGGAAPSYVADAR